MNRVFRRIRAILLELSNGKLIWVVGFTPSHFVRRFFYRLFGMKIGSGSSIHMGLSVYNCKGIKIGSDSIVGEWAVLDGRDSLSIGNHVDIATGVMIYNSEHNIEDPDFKSITAPVEIGDYVFIGPRAIILPGIKVGEGAVIAAGAVVTKDVAPFTVVGGVPAKVIKERSKDLSYRLGRAAWFR